MAIDAATLKALIGRELAHVSDIRVTAHIRGLLVEPKVILGDWDYGEPGEQFPCWIVLDDEDTGIAYCEDGFGPKCPWGLVWLAGDDPRRTGIGMDSGWFPTFLDAFFDSFAATALPIWRVFRVGPSGIQPTRDEPMTEETSWDAAWQQVEAWRKSDPDAAYYCHHSIAIHRPGEE